jgi:hypothetical protein
MGCQRLNDQDIMKFFRNVIAAFSSVVSARRTENQPSSSPEDTMKEMRHSWLSRVPEMTESKNPDEILAVLMDWPLGDCTATVLASSGGDASLYTTSTFGIIGGIGHENVRKAAVEFVRCAEHFSNLGSPARSFPYPDGQTLRFYLVAPSGVRAISFAMKEIETENSPARVLFAYGQQVLTELRISTEQQ